MHISKIHVHFSFVERHLYAEFDALIAEQPSGINFDLVSFVAYILNNSSRNQFVDALLKKIPEF